MTHPQFERLLGIEDKTDFLSLSFLPFSSRGGRTSQTWLGPRIGMNRAGFSHQINILE